MANKPISQMKEIEKTLSIVKYQRELQVLLLEMKELSKHNLGLMKRCQSCAMNIAKLKPLVKKELLELIDEERKQANKLLNELHLKI